MLRRIFSLIAILLLCATFPPRAQAAFWYAAGGKQYAPSLMEACLLQHDYSGVYPTLVGTRLLYNSAGMPITLECAWKTVPASLFWDFSYGNVECGAGEVADGRAPNGCIKTDQSAENVCTAVGNPINALTGSKVQKVVDFSTAGPKALQFIRYYNSSSGGISRVGPGWSSNYDRQFDKSTPTTPTYVHITRPDGIVARFKLVSGNYQPAYWNGSGWASPRLDVSWKLEVDGTGFKFTDEAKNVEHYDSNGKLTSIDYIGGYSVALAYDTNGYNTTATDSLGRVLTFTYNSAGLLSTMTDPAGYVYSYAYAYTGHTHPATTNLTGVASQGLVLEKVIYPDATPLVSTDNPFTLYHYDLPDQSYALTGITDENGNRYATWTYDTDWQATSSSHAGGVDDYTISYDATNSVQTVTNPLDKQTKYHYTTSDGHRQLTSIEGIVSSNCAASDSTYAYDANGYLSEITDEEGNVTTLTNDSLGLVTAKTEADGETEERTTSTTWDTGLRKPTVIETSRLRIELTYDGDGRVTERKEIDVTSHTVPYSTSGQQRIWTYTYTTDGLLDTIDGPLSGTGDTIDYDYDGDGFVSKITDQLGHETDVTSVDGNGLPLSITDQNGVVTNLTYNERGWLTNVVVNPGGSQAETTITYDDVGQVTNVTNPDGAFIQYAYSTAHRLTNATNNIGDKTLYTYTDMGQIDSTTIKNVSNVTKFGNTFTYDELGRLLKIIGSDSGETTYGYDKVGNAISLEDPRNKTYSQAFDALNRVISVTDPLSNTTASSHDEADDVTGVTDARSNTTSYVYNAWGEAIRTDSPDSGVTDYEYDAAGNLTKITDARSKVTNLSYDNAGRLLTKTYPTASSEDIAYTYDAISGGNVGIGKLTSITDESGSTAIKYDALGHVISDTRVIGSNTYAVVYTYDAAGRVLTVTYPSGRIVSLTRNAVGNITDIATKPDALSSNSDIVTGAAYLPFGPLSGLTFGNNLALGLTYDADYRLTDIDTSYSSTTIQDLAYTLDLSDNITAITDGLSSVRNQTFGYDDVNRLTSASGLYGSLGYSYDEVGNRIGETSGSPALTLNYPSSSNRLDNITDGSNTRSFTYLASGQISEDVRTPSADYEYTYNDAGRLSSVSLSSSPVATYLYNADGQRAQKTVGSTVTQFVYDLDGHLLVEADSSGNPIREYIWLDDMPVALIDSSGTPATYYIQTDHLGRPQKMTDGSRNIVWDGVFDPFGKVTSISGAATNLLMFPGQYHDSESQLSQNWYRDFDPSIGRYVESDPIGLFGGINTYAYVDGKPLTSTDVEGLWCTSSDGFTTCESASGPRFKVPTPIGFVDFTGDEETYHYYDVQVPVLGDQSDCAFQALVNSPTPGDSKPASREGTLNDAVVIPFVSNPVISYRTVDENSGAPIVVNITKSDSQFKSGYVARMVKNGVMHSYGEGTSWAQSSKYTTGYTQQFANDLVWGNQMRNMSEQCGCKR